MCIIYNEANRHVTETVWRNLSIAGSLGLKGNLLEEGWGGVGTQKGTSIHSPATTPQALYRCFIHFAYLILTKFLRNRCHSYLMVIRCTNLHITSLWLRTLFCIFFSWWIPSIISKHISILNFSYYIDSQRMRWERDREALFGNSSRGSYQACLSFFWEWLTNIYCIFNNVIESTLKKEINITLSNAVLRHHLHWWYQSTTCNT